MTSSLLRIEPLLLPFDAALTMPGSKSHANRAIIAACLAKGTTNICNATPCDDVVLLVKNLQRMGFAVQWKDRRKGTLVIRGGIPQNKNSKTVTLFCDNAGTTLRFLTSLACIVPGQWIITGNARMCERPIGDLTNALKTLGAQIEDTDGCPPLHIRGRNLKGGNLTLDASKSSQFLTSLLLIGPLLPQGLSITAQSTLASAQYVELTREVLADFGVSVRKQRGNFHVPHSPLRANVHYQIEGDWSAAGAFLILAELSESHIHFTNLAEDSRQADRLLPDFIAQLRSTGKRSVDCSAIPDQVMNLAVLAACRKGTTHISGARNLRLKETNRLKVLTSELKKAGIKISEMEDGLLVQGDSAVKSAVLDAHGDHRMAMCFAILGSVHPGIRIKNSECVSKSYPHFFRDLMTLHTFSRCIALVGMRGCGKSSLAKKLASKLPLKRIDTDTVFERHYGRIGDFVQKKGWKAFRLKEEQIVAQSLQTGSIVSLGGGAIESAKSRRLLQNVIVLWLEASVQGTVKRLQKTHRPALTDLPLQEEVSLMLKKRNPLYKSVANITLPEKIPFSKQTSFVLSRLRALCSR